MDKPIKTIYYSNKYSQMVFGRWVEDMVDIVENVDGHDIGNYVIQCHDLRKLKKQFENQKSKFKLVFVKGGDM